ncbi:MAG: hypothetical protein HQL63_02530 [Magnetococcales bacterium]|nr:hypothetical protein [Magnetococcales bacterium]MBF0323220.1 hypothetical protein [Magnetococcales bacterium]
MNMIKVSLAEASRVQMQEFARDVLGVTLTRNLGADAMRERIRQAGYEEIDVKEEQAEEKKGQEYQEDADTVRIHLQRSDGKGGDRPVPVAVNGSLMLIPRGKAVRVPRKFVEALQNAKTTHFEQDEHGEFHPRETLSYPFSFAPVAASSEE